MYFVTAMALWQHSLNDERDIRIVTLLSNRSSMEAQRVIGFLANKAIYRVQINDNMKLAELITHVKQVVLAAHRHQEVPYALIIRELNKEMDTDQESISNVLVLYTRRSFKEANGDGLYFAPVDLQRSIIDEPFVTSYKLTVRAIQSLTALTGIVNYKYEYGDEEVGMDASRLATILTSIISPLAENRSVTALMENVRSSMHTNGSP